MTGARITKVDVSAYTFPTDEPEADGTLQWDSTTAVTVVLHAGEATGLGWSYTSPAAATVIESHLVDAVRGRDACDIAAGHEAMRRACRNLGTRGLVAQAISAVDIAWWDLKARVLQTSIAGLLGKVRDAVPIYGSGGFTTMSEAELRTQVEEWASVGCRAMKIKIGEAWGSALGRDLARVEQLRDFAGDSVALMVDANGGYDRGQARQVGRVLDELGVVWFEEPVSSDDVDGLARLRDVLDCDVTAGEYAADLPEVRHLLPVVDCLQLDATRCGGYTGFLAGAASARAVNLDVSAHCAPALHAPLAAAITNLRHIEWFADHVRLEPRLVDGLADVHGGAIKVRTDVLGHGMELRNEVDPQ